jgi:hypothetical protein
VEADFVAEAEAVVEGVDVGDDRSKKDELKVREPCITNHFYGNSN